MTASIVTYPHEVIRTRLQTLRKPLIKGVPGMPVPGIIRTAKSIVVFEGWRALYRGLSVNLVRTVPNSAVTMVTYVVPPVSLCRCMCADVACYTRYEMLMRYLNARTEDSDS